jgi:hypothetical protein
MFEDFWQQYPRKVAKKSAEKAWKKLSDIEQTKALNAVSQHVKYWKTKETEHEFIPHPATWLNQARFEDELVIEPPKAKPAKVDKSWMFTNEGIEAKAKELGILGNGYDSYQTLKEKCIRKLYIE